MKISLVLFDLEGVLVVGKQFTPLDGAVEFVNWVSESRMGYRIATNNTTDTAPEISATLRNHGFPITSDRVYTPVGVGASMINDLALQEVIIIGSHSIIEEFCRQGVRQTDQPKCGAVVVGLDTNLSYRTLSLACEAISQHGAKFIALHKNRYFTDEAGKQSPSVGATVAAIEYVTQVSPIVVGKPSSSFFLDAISGFAPEEVLMISDNALADLTPAKNLGIRTCLISPCESSTQTLDRQLLFNKPDLQVENLNELRMYLEQ